MIAPSAYPELVIGLVYVLIDGLMEILEGIHKRLSGRMSCPYEEGVESREEVLLIELLDEVA